MTPLKKGQTREEDRYMWGFGRSPNPHIYLSPLLEGSFFQCTHICYGKDLTPILPDNFQRLAFSIISVRKSYKMR
jgi:hypothetical protein